MHQIIPTEFCLHTPVGGTVRWVFLHKQSAAHSRALRSPREPLKQISFRTQGPLSGPGQLAAPLGPKQLG